MTASLHIFPQKILKKESSPCVLQDIELDECFTDLVAAKQRNYTAREFKKKKERVYRGR